MSGSAGSIEGCYPYIYDKLSSLLEVKEQAWRKLLECEQRKQLQLFLETVQKRKLVLWLEGNELLVANEIPEKIQKSLVFFIKASSGPISPDNISRRVICGQLNGAVIDDLAAMSASVMLPMLSNAPAPVSPEPAMKGVSETMKRLITAVHVTADQNDNAGAEGHFYLQSLEVHINAMRKMDDFKNLPATFQPIFDELLNIWQQSEHLRKYNMFINIVRDITEQVVSLAKAFIAGTDMLASEPPECLEKLKIALHVLGTFKSLYLLACERSQCAASAWPTNVAMLFDHLDAIMRRCFELSQYANARIQFAKLENVDIGGTKGAQLTTAVRSLFNNFSAACEKIKESECNPMDLTDNTFPELYTSWHSTVTGIESRLVMLLHEAFATATSVESSFKLLVGFEGLLDRSNISSSLSLEHITIIRCFEKELRKVNEAFERQKSCPPVPHGRPPFAGTLAWTKSLKGRISRSFEKLEGFPATILQSDDGLEMQRLFQSVIQSIERYEAQTMAKWCSMSQQVSTSKLNLPVLKSTAAKNGSQFATNFHPDLSGILQEMTMMLSLQNLPQSIPTVAMDFYKKSTIVRSHINSIDNIAQGINAIHSLLTDVNKPLVAGVVALANKAVLNGTESITWSSPNLDEYIKETNIAVQTAKSMLLALHAVENGAAAASQRWLKQLPLFTPSSSSVLENPVKNLDFGFVVNLVSAALKSRSAMVVDSNNELQQLIKTATTAVAVERSSPHWQTFEGKVANNINKDMFNAVIESLVSLEHVLQSNTPCKACFEIPDAKADYTTATKPVSTAVTPQLIRIELRIQALASKGVTWVPSLRSNDGSVTARSAGSTSSLQSLFTTWRNELMDLFSGFELIGLPISKSSSYATSKIITSNTSVLAALGSVQQALDAKLAECDAAMGIYSKYSFIIQQKQESMALTSIPVVKALASYEKEMERYQLLQQELQSLPDTVALGIILINAQEAKQSLIAEVSVRMHNLSQQINAKIEKAIQDMDMFLQSYTPILGSSTTASATSRPTQQANTRRPSLSSTTGASSPRKPVKGADASTRQSVTQSRMTNMARRPDRSSIQMAREELSEEHKANLYETLRSIQTITKKASGIEEELVPIAQAALLLQKFGAPLSEDMQQQLQNAPSAWSKIHKKVSSKREGLAGAIAVEAAEVKKKVELVYKQTKVFRSYFLNKAPFAVPGSSKDLTLAKVQEALEIITALKEVGLEGHPSLKQQRASAEALREEEELLGLPPNDLRSMNDSCIDELGLLKSLWDFIAAVLTKFSTWATTPWKAVQADVLLEETKRIIKDMKTLPKTVREFEAYKALEDKLKAMAGVLPLISDLAHPAMRERHWAALMQSIKKSFVVDERLTLGDILALGLHKYGDACAEVVDCAQKELIIEKSLAKIASTWKGLVLSFPAYPGRQDGIKSLLVDESVMEALESDGVVLQNMATSKHVQANSLFQSEVLSWQKSLGTVDAVLSVWTDAQRKWQALESIFLGSADIRTQLPEDATRFDTVNENFKNLMAVAPQTTLVIEACCYQGRRERLEGILLQLELCEKALQNYLETKRLAFPRFYFVSPADLLDILARGTDPHAIERHLPKLFDNLHHLEWKKDEAGKLTNVAVGMYSGEGEHVKFATECLCEGPAEVWLEKVVDAMRLAVRTEFKLALPAYEETAREKWVFNWSAQNTVVVSRIYFTQQVNEAFDEIEHGNEDALKQTLERQKTQLRQLIELINGPLSKNDRKKLITLCTIDVHARDVVSKLISDKVDNSQAFQWQSQLRYTLDSKTGDCKVQICDAEIAYQHEYIGNCGCLCITPLTDRCYITLTQAQRLILGGAPAGPAGTGKTETVKDLARALGVQCYVFNCSDQMDYKAMAQIYKGLSQTGAWGCFDEFNRIPVSVLSVCSTQYKTILDALRAQKQRFLFDGVDIPLRKSVMAFITMNPGYPGRSELPESVKALFRPVSMAAPDLSLICEVMLMAEGFQNSKLLARKFIVLYRLCEDLLSKARHYDWKLRAIKTTLYVAGGMKRQSSELSEDKVLLRALRDFNLGKLTADDAVVFKGLIEDLFPKTSSLVPRTIDHSFESKVKQAAKELGYQPDEPFCLKVSQLREIFEVRWSVFLLGPAGCGKSAIWKTLQRALQLSGAKVNVKVVNPKSVNRNELYGCIHSQTREWKEGILSVTFREMANNSTAAHQWIVLDGDIDAEWIESMNTVMDDNKMLTLASNERIPLTSSMRLLLEINHMNHCSPATVSRGGVIYINADDVGWRPFLESWLETKPAIQYRQLLPPLFNKYVDSCLEFVRRSCKTIVPLPPINMVETLCKLLEGLMPTEVPKGSAAPDKKLLEAQFCFACIWAFGGCLSADKIRDYREIFSKWWISEHKFLAFPPEGTVFDYYLDADTCLLVPWSAKVPKFQYSAGSNAADIASLFVHTVETVRIQYLMRLIMKSKSHVMLAGGSGTGKTAIVRDLLQSLDSYTHAVHTVNLNSYHDGPSMQLALEAPLEKKAGVRYGPPGSKSLVYFIDDLNTPTKDKYDTQTALELIRQAIDNKGWYDKTKNVQKEVNGTHYIACMNPTSGSFTITPRLQRQFATFAVQPPTDDTIRCIYLQLLEGHLAGAGYSDAIRQLAPTIIKATMELHSAVVKQFVPSAVKFHYIFTLREISSIVGGLLKMTPNVFKTPLKVVRLWIHECERVYCDRLLNASDVSTFNQMRVSVCRRNFEGIVDMVSLEAKPIIFASFGSGTAAHQEDTGGQPLYDEIPSAEALKTGLTARLDEYNETNPAMDLVLFHQAAEHVVRIARVLDAPSGNFMLVGVGGSGKQSLSKLAAFTCGYEVRQIAVTAGYGVAEFKADFLSLYEKAGVKSTKIVLLLTDNHIVNERFLVVINDYLSTGIVTDLFSPEDKEAFCGSVRAEVKAAGLLDSPDNCWSFFINKVRRNFRVILCFSPVGDKFRTRARQFPSLTSFVTYDWLQPWPHEALISVAGKFLAAVPELATNAPLRAAIAAHMAAVHTSVEVASKRFLQQYRRYNYTTPKSYMELIGQYQQLLSMKKDELGAARERLENGVEKIASTRRAVEGLKIILQSDQVVVEQKKAATLVLIESIGREKAAVDAAVEGSRGDEEQAAALQARILAVQTECSRDLAAAEPIIQAAEAALSSLDKASLGELKSFSNPAVEVVQVVVACMILTAPDKAAPKDLSWAAGKKWMGAQSLDNFLKSLVLLDKDNLSASNVAKVESEFVSKATFNPESIRVKSVAAAGLCSWVINICKYFRIYQQVAPKRAALAEANAELANANKKLAGIRARVKELADKVAALEANLAAATKEKNEAIAQAEKTANKAALADRLISGLGGEFERWTAAIQDIKAKEGSLLGDALLVAAFVSYAGAFNAPLRQYLVKECWIPDAKQRGIPQAPGLVPLDFLCTGRTKAMWANQGLQKDTLSVENAAVVESTRRWPLLIDPQLQGIKWIKGLEGPNRLKVIQLGTPKYMDTTIRCVEQGVPLLIENLRDSIDPAIDNLVQKKVLRRGRAQLLQLGGREIEYNPKFKLYLHTKLANPHYGPEVAAQTTIINFTVTSEGLEDQLLALIVDHERPELQERAATLQRQLAQYTITLQELEDGLLARLAASKGDILEDVPLVTSLEETKKTAVEVAQKVVQAKETELIIDAAREVYRPVARRGSLMYFTFDSLSGLDRVYWYSMAAFVGVLIRGMDETPGGIDESKVPAAKRLGQVVDVQTRLELLVEGTTATLFEWITQGLFERHKAVVAAQLCFAMLRSTDALPAPKRDFLLRAPQVLGKANPVSEWLPSNAWQKALALAEQPEFATLPDDLSASAKRWKEWIELEAPENEPLPGDWKRVSELDRLLVIRALRGDRFSAALPVFVGKVLGPKFVKSQPFNLEKAMKDSGPGTPIMIFLSPGVDAASSVEAIGRKRGFTAESGRFATVSLGQGQEEPAMAKLKAAHANGGWVLLQNIHLTMDWTSGLLERTIDALSQGAHPDFQLFLSAEPPPSLELPLPPSLLQNCTKLTNEPPEGLKANLIRSWSQFDDEILEQCSRQGEFKTIVFALCFFHAAILERKKFGVGNLPGTKSGIGWNMGYPFNRGDLLNCAQTAANYLDTSPKVPWEDLRYIFGEILYGGHVVEGWDRRLVTAYLQQLFTPSLLEGQAELCPGFKPPHPTLNHSQVLKYIEDKAPGRAAVALGMHPNAEIGVRQRKADALCASLLSLQSNDLGGGGASSIEERAKATMDAIMENLPPTFEIAEVRGKAEDIGPFVTVLLQELERMNLVLVEIKASLAELALGLKGELSMSEKMDELAASLAVDRVPSNWASTAYLSLRTLSSWLVNLHQRHSQLAEWSSDPCTPPNSIWLPGLFNPQAFLTAVMQTTARKNGWSLDATVLATEVTKKSGPAAVDAPPREGAYIHGLWLEGARWDDKLGTLEDSRPKEQITEMPVIHVKAVPAEKAVPADIYQCPVYFTESRFRQEVFTAQLRSKQPWTKWAAAGVALLLDVASVPT